LQEYNQYYKNITMENEFIDRDELFH